MFDWSSKTVPSSIKIKALLFAFSPNLSNPFFIKSDLKLSRVGAVIIKYHNLNTENAGNILVDSINESFQFNSGTIH